MNENNNNDNDNNVITFEEVQARIKDKKLEEYTSQDVFDRFIAYGNIGEEEEPTIQKLLIKHNYEDILVDIVNFITDKEVIKSLFTSNLWSNRKIKAIQGSIKSTKFIPDEVIPKYQRPIIRFIESSNSRELELKGHIIFTEEDKRKYEEQLMSYRDNSIVIVEGTDLKCFVKTYEDIDYHIR